MESRIKNEQQKLIEKIKGKLKNGEFKNYINLIRFPYFKNFKKNSKVSFNFPLTVLVGKNGSGKSSILHALYGAPKGQTIQKFWFSTDTDPIEEGGMYRNCFIYGYVENTKSDDLREVLYQRAPRPGTRTKSKNADYWEASKPVKKYGMDELTRNMPVEKNVEFIDFRESMSAYDKFFYFGDTWGLKNSKKQDFVRNIASPHLKNIFDYGKIYHDSKGNKRNFEKITLSKEDVKVVNKILGNDYVKIEFVYHNMYRSWGSQQDFSERVQKKIVIQKLTLVVGNIQLPILFINLILIIRKIN